MAVRAPLPANGLTATRTAETTAGVTGLVAVVSLTAAIAATATAGQAIAITIVITRIPRRHRPDTRRATNPMVGMVGMMASSRTSNLGRTVAAEAEPLAVVVMGAVDTAEVVAADMIIRTTTTVHTTSRTATMARRIVKEATVVVDKEEATVAVDEEATVVDSKQAIVAETKQATAVTAAGVRAAGVRAATVAEAKGEDADAAGTTTLVGVAATVGRHTIKVVATDKGHTAITVAGTTMQVEDASGRLLLHLHDPISLLYTLSLCYIVIVPRSTSATPKSRVVYD